MNDFNLSYQTYLDEFEAYLNNYVAKFKTNPTLLGESMAYSLQGGGKRIRPVLMLACADVLSVSHENIMPYALALEMIHTYSLIHDDLPAMDNDDFRRGKPSCHKAFGEANAILAGDALLNEAYAICFEQCMKGEEYVIASRLLNEYAGAFGMIAGQSADLLFTGRKTDVSEEELHFVYEYKTGKLLLAPVAVANILAKNKHYLSFEYFGKLLGLLFQMTDDILDVTGNFDELGKSIGKDETENKLTCVKLYGLEGAKIRAENCAKECHAILESIEGDTEFLHALNNYIANILARMKKLKFDLQFQ